MGNELWAVYSKYEGLCLVSNYEECKEIYDSEVQFMEDEGYSHGIEDDDCVYMMKVAEMTPSDEAIEEINKLIEEGNKPVTKPFPYRNIKSITIEDEKVIIKGEKLI